MVQEKDNKIIHEIIEDDDFNDIVIESYNNDQKANSLAAYHFFARSQMPPGTAKKRDLANFSEEIPFLNTQKCSACLQCIALCPESTVHAKVVQENETEFFLDNFTQDKEKLTFLRNQFIKTGKFQVLSKKNGQESGELYIAIDPSKCKGCALCLNVCEDGAFTMVKKNEKVLNKTKSIFDFYNDLPETEQFYYRENETYGAIFSPEAHLYSGGVDSCAGCGETTALNMMLAATGFKYGKENIGIIKSAGCSKLYSSTYPYNPFMVSCTNSAAGNILSLATGIRKRWDQLGWKDKKLWIIAGLELLNESGFHSINSLAEKNIDIKIILFDRGEHIEDNIFMQQFINNRGVYLAQIITYDVNKYYQAIDSVNKFNGPAILNVYTCCPPENGVANNMSQQQARLAVRTRAFPLFTFDPDRGKKIIERLSLEGNPSLKEDWYTDPKTGEIFDFIKFAGTEGRYSKQFNQDGSPSEDVKNIQNRILKNWRLLRELVDIKSVI
jgi:pyruvate ferredoxin oxidoreductase beta subunit